MHKVMPLVILFSVLLFGMSYTQDSYSMSESFELEFGVSGIGKPGMFLEPQHLAIDLDNNIYVTDLGNSRVQKFDSQGNYIMSWGSQGSEPGHFSNPSGIAVADGSIFVVDNKLNKVQKFDSEGNFVLAWGTPGNDNGQFKSPNGIAITDDKFIYVVDTGNSRVQKFTFDGQYISSFGRNGISLGNLVSPIDIAIDNIGNLFVTDPGNYRINIYNSDGNFQKTFNSSFGGFSIIPEGIIFDENNNFYFVDSRNNRIIHSNDSGLSLSIFGNMGIGQSHFKFPRDVAVSSDGFLYVTDTQGHRIQKFSTAVSQEKLLDNETSIEQELEIKEKHDLITRSEHLNEKEVELQPPNPIPNDFKKPIIIVPEDIFIEATGGLTHVNIGQAVANDESGILSLSNNEPKSFSLGITTVIWTAVDGAGNMAIASQIVTVQDTLPAKIEQLSEIILEAKSEYQNLVQFKTPNVSDAVGVISIENDAPEIFPVGETIVTWTAIDVIGNISTMQQKIILIDSTPPRVDIPEDIVIEATNLNGNIVMLIEPEVFDDIKITSFFSDAPEFFPLGDTVVTWTATDDAGNIATSTQLVTIVDKSAPEILVNNVTLEATNPDGIDITLTVPEVIDIQEVSFSNDAPDTFPFGETIVTWIVTDQSGNVSTQIQIVNVIDSTQPILVVPTDIEIEANGVNTIIDTLGELTVEDISGISYVSNDAPETFSLGETVITWIASDNFENVISNTQLVRVIDTNAPEIVAPSDIKIEAVDSTENFIELVGVRVSDAVEISLVTNNAPEVFPLGETIVTWTATDTSGNSMSDIQIVTVVDTTAPTITGPNDIVLEITDNNGMLVNIGQLFALDQVDSNITITNDSSEIFHLGNTIVTWSASDFSGNSVLFTQTISIIDTTSPQIIQPVDIIQEAEEVLSNLVILENLQILDIVGIASITNDAPEFFPLGDTVVTWTATDDAGNIATSTQLISIIDTISPSITIPEPVIVEASSEQENYIILDNALAQDKIEISLVTNNAPEVFPLGETIVTWTATDTSGNSMSDIQIVTVVDTTAPTIRALEDIVVEAIGLQNNKVELDMIIADDIVGIASITNDAPEFFPLGDTVVTWTATDDAGNIATSQQQVILVDNTSPSIISPENIEIEAASKDSNAVKTGIANAYDTIQLAEITNDAPEVFPLGETIVTWTATDTSGNSMSDIQIVTVVDTTAPTIRALEDIVVDATSSSVTKVDLILPSTNDLISEVIIDNDVYDATFVFGETIVTWSATDESGNVSFVEQKVIIVDSSAPELQTPEDIIIDAISLENIIEIGSPMISDIIDSQPLVTNDAPEFFPLGDTVVTWTATDDAGNSVTSTQLVNVQACGNSISYYHMIIGTAEDDFLTGTSLPDLIFGQGGDDIIFGGKGNDCVLAGEGNDIIFGNAGNDNISGDQGNDIIKGESGNDTISGGIGLDVIDGGDDTDTCRIIDEQNNDIIIKCETNE